MRRAERFWLHGSGVDMGQDQSRTEFLGEVHAEVRKPSTYGISRSRFRPTTPEPLVPSKRRRDDRDERNGNGHEHRRARASGQYDSQDISPPRSRAPASPANTRHAFIPDRDGFWSPTGGNELAAANTNSSPRTRKSSAVHISGSPERISAGPGSSPLATLRRQNGSHGVTPRQNATRTHLSENSEDMANGVDDISSDKVDFNGLKDVPTGPKQRAMAAPSIPPGQSIRIPDDIGPVVKQQPHIFIRGVPPRVATIKHLYLYLRKYVRTQEDILVDRSGYYVLFQKSTGDRQRLESCCREFNREKLFSQYSLAMTPFPDGQHPPNPNATLISPASPPAEVPTNLQVFIDSTEEGPPGNRASTDPRLQNRELPAHINTSSPTDTTSRPLHHSSPRHLSSRQDKDDSSSSISGLTDRSASRFLKCHTCNEAPLSGTDVLAQCSSCPRRYHYRCHGQPPIPANLEPDHSWQCRRCVRKQVQPKSRLSNASIARTDSPLPRTGQPHVSEILPGEGEHRKDPEPVPLADALRNGIASIADDVGESRDTAAENIPNGRSIDIDRPVTTANQQADDSSIRNDDSRSHEADDLVEKSFSLPKTAAPVNVKTGKLNLTRKKIAPRDTSQTGDASIRHEMVSPVSALTDAEHLESRIFGSEPGEATVASPRKRKSHKWAGGGADKDVIQAGIDTTTSSDAGLQTNGQASHATESHDVALADGVVMQPEVPDSPDEVRKPPAPENFDKENGISKGLMGNFSVEGNVNDMTPLIDGDATVKDDERPTGPSKRTGYKSRNTDKCVQCQRTIAFDPRMKLKLCSHCKKERTVDVEQLAGKELSESPGLPNGAAKPSELSRAFTDDAPVKTGPRKACEECKRKHQACHHHLHLSTNKPTDKLQHDSPMHEDLEIGNVNAPDHDLDFLTAKPALEQGHRDAKPKPAPLNSSHGHPQPSAEADPSPLPATPLDDSRESPAKKQPNGKKQRQSHTVAARGERDLGNSFRRPPNTYVKLIAMALMAHKGQRIKAVTIVNWIAESIPGYNLGEGNNWENGIRATITMNREGNKANVRALWKMYEEHGARKSQGCWYELLPGIAETMLQWDPVLKEPVSPAKPLSSRAEHRGASKLLESPTVDEAEPMERPQQQVTPSKKPGHEEPQDVGDLEPVDVQTLNQASTLRLHRQKPEERKRKRNTNPAGPNAMDIDSVDGDYTGDSAVSLSMDQTMSKSTETSDDEPLLKRRKVAAEKGSSRGDSLTVDVNAVQANADQQTTPKVPRKHLSLAHNTQLGDSNQLSLGQLIKQDAENVEYSAKSLFAEWPEYDPANAFDREAKLAEIKKRPTRKQRFGVRTRDPWSAWKPNTPKINDTSSIRPSRKTTTFDAETGDDTTREYGSLEAFFELPNDPTPFLTDGQISYRDGNRGDDGTLRRAKKIYPTGYA